MVANQLTVKLFVTSVYQMIIINVIVSVGFLMSSAWSPEPHL